MLLENGMVQFLRTHEFSFKVWLSCEMIMGAEINFSSTFPLYEAITLFCFNAKKPLSVYQEPEDTLAGFHS